MATTKNQNQIAHVQEGAGKIGKLESLELRKETLRHLSAGKSSEEKWEPDPFHVSARFNEYAR